MKNTLSPKAIKKIAFGGGCHWCTEAVFKSVEGVLAVDQGWVSSTHEDSSFSEGVIVHYDQKVVGLTTLVDIHLRTHSSTNNHQFREKYRSAIYYFEERKKDLIWESIKIYNEKNSKKTITKVIPFKDFRLNEEKYLDYYSKNKDKPFSKKYIDTKIRIVDEMGLKKR